MIGSKKAMYAAFGQYLVQIYKDAMLILLCIAPFLCGIFFRYLIPVLQELILRYFHIREIFAPYYLLFDIGMSTMTPLLYCFAAAYIILGEIDDGISRYLAITPVGKKGYLASRLGFPAIIAFFLSVLCLRLFSLSKISFLMSLLVSVMATLMGFMEALLIVSVAGNKVEGMAVSKMTGILILGLPAPFFLMGRVQYLLFFLPSFWLAKFALQPKLVSLLAFGIMITLWIGMLYHLFKNKIH